MQVNILLSAIFLVSFWSALDIVFLAHPLKFVLAGGSILTLFYCARTRSIDILELFGVSLATLLLLMFGSAAGIIYPALVCTMTGFDLVASVVRREVLSQRKLLGLVVIAAVSALYFLVGLRSGDLVSDVSTARIFAYPSDVHPYSLVLNFLDIGIADDHLYAFNILYLLRLMTVDLFKEIGHSVYFLLWACGLVLVTNVLFVKQVFVAKGRYSVIRSSVLFLMSLVIHLALNPELPGRYILCYVWPVILISIVEIKSFSGFLVSLNKLDIKISLLFLTAVLASRYYFSMMSLYPEIKRHQQNIGAYRSLIPECVYNNADPSSSRVLLHSNPHYIRNIVAESDLKISSKISGYSYLGFLSLPGAMQRYESFQLDNGYVPARVFMLLEELLVLKRRFGSICVIIDDSRADTQNYERAFSYMSYPKDFEFMVKLLAKYGFALHSIGANRIVWING